MRSLLLLLFIISSIVNAQEDPYANFRTVDTTQYRPTRALYFYDLTLKESHNAGKVLIEWKNQQNITYHMIEMRDPDSKEIIYRQKHYTNIAEFPEDGLFTIYPLYYKQKGEAVSISLKDSKARDYQPISPDSYYRELEKVKAAKQRDEKRIEREYRNEQLRVQAADERANRITPKVVALVFIVLFFSVVIVFGIWLVRYLTKDKDPKQDSYRKNNQGWG